MEKVWLITYVVLWAVVILQSILLFNYMKFTNSFVQKITQIGNVSFEQGVNIGSEAPIFQVKDQFKNIFKVEPNQLERKVLLFISDSCPTCKRLISTINSQVPLDTNNIIFISNGKIENNYIDILNENNIKFIVNDELFQKYNVRTSPTVIIVNEAGRIHDSFVIDDIKEITNYQQNKAS